MNPKRRRWTAEEVEFLRSVWGEMSDSQIAKELKLRFGRDITYHSIYKKRRGLGLLKDVELTRRRFHISCKLCGKEFRSASPSAIYCSEACKQESYRKRWRRRAIRMNDPIIEIVERRAVAKLEELGFQDILWLRPLSKTFPIDILARKEGKLCGFEVTISPKRVIDEGTRRIVEYLGIEMYVCHVNLDKGGMIINRLKRGRWFSSALGVRNTVHRESHNRNFTMIYSDLT